MSVVANEVRKGAYLDSVALMRLTAELRAMAGVDDAGVLVGTSSNRQILAEAGLLVENGEAFGAGDLVIAIKARDRSAAELALVAARAALDRNRSVPRDGVRQNVGPRTLRSGLDLLPGANLALISVPGSFATAEAMKAIRRGLNVMIFSDNVPVTEEIELKTEAQRRGVLVMGPDCGTAIISGMPVAFANVVPRGDIGIIGASGTGIQEASCLIARAGRGVSHAIGTGGRDLSREVGAISTKMAIELLAADPATRHILVISKPPDAAIATDVIACLAAAGKPATVCFLGSEPRAMPSGISMAPTLEAAAIQATGAQTVSQDHETLPGSIQALKRRGSVRGLFAGGTLCLEAQLAFRDAGYAAYSNIPLAPGKKFRGDTNVGHVLLDLGDDAYTRGRPHPMIEPSVRNGELSAAIADQHVGVILLDMVLGYGAHPDPAGALVNELSGLRDQVAGALPAIVASVTGTDGDPQCRKLQVRKLEEAGVLVASSNLSAARLAMRIMARG